MSSTITAKAVAGRRIEFTYFRDRNQPEPPVHPGIITGTEPGYDDQTRALVRLDGTRSNLHVPADSEGLTYLDQVVPVPDLPMGRFHPTPEDLEQWDWNGIQVFSIGEDGEAIALTGDLARAVEAINAYRKDMAGCLYNPAFDTVTTDDLVHRWAYFEWQPEDSECPWFVHWTDEGDDMAIQIHHFPT